MAGILSAAGYRRTVLAVTVTGTVCAGVAFILYSGVKKLQAGKKATSAKKAGDGLKTPVVDGEQPAKKRVEDVEKKSDNHEPTPEPAVPVQVDERVPAPAQPKTSPSPVAEKPKLEAAQIPDPDATKIPKQDATKIPNPVKVVSEQATDKADRAAKGFVAKVETIVSAATQSAMAKVTEPVPIVVTSPAKDVVVKETVKDVAEKVTPKDMQKDPIKDVKKAVVEDIVEKVEVKEVAASPASGDGPGSLSSLDSRFDSDVIIIEDVGKVGAADNVTKPASHVAEGAGDVIRDIPAPINITTTETLSEQQDTEAPVFMGAPSSLSDDIEIIHDSPASTDTTDTSDSVVSGDFVKCGAMDVERSTDLSQAIENIKEVEDSNKEEIVSSEATQPKEIVTSGDGEDSNANFEVPSSTEKVESDAGLPKPEINENNPEENK